MDVAWLGRLDGDLLVLQMVSGDLANYGVMPGWSVHRDQSLFAKVLSGELPSLMADVQADPRSCGLPVVTEFGIRSYAATPVTDVLGRVYGMVGCMGREPCPSLPERDGGLLRMVASFLTEFVIDLRRLWDERSEVWRQVREVLDQGGPRMVFQPVADLTTGQTVAVESLARFPAGVRGPDELFADATGTGLGRELELAAVRNALHELPQIPADVLLAVNASPATVTSQLVDLVVQTGTPHRVTVEITERNKIGNDRDVLLSLEELRGHGTHIAVDDVGSGYSGIEELLQLRPDVIKVDAFIVHGIDCDPARRTVASGLARLAGDIGGHVVAEGIESRAELDAVVDAGIGYGQGYLLGRPSADIHEACLGKQRPTATRTGERTRRIPRIHGPQL
ncbi:EAL domain-containing protein [Frankia sp. AgB1.9]|nr:EAL domain-containing protein [Frankia sp. AgW1.1]MBL7546315.1 EAL domain-containing protein [Frankia sp. AgB1.9]MBL7618640.1 EAL domain-containing protein [Frankia sp. AgB1.8]